MRLVQGPLGLFLANRAASLARPAAKRAMDAMMTMHRIDIAKIEAARADQAAA
jgi:hypothetical protein